MCGISAFVSKKGESASVIRRATEIIKHRGPDDEGYFLVDMANTITLAGGPDTPAHVWNTSTSYRPTEDISNCSGIYQVGLGHRRLSILDLSASGHFPMCDSTKRYWITYNGEIYNYIELRDELISKGRSFSSNSDTEVILQAYAEWGTDCLQRFNGMFAFVLYDLNDKRLFLARDRFGIKPLYYWRSPQDVIYFGSEIKQFTVCPGWAAQLNKQRAYDYLFYSIADHTDETMFDGVFQFRPGHMHEGYLEDLFVPSKQLKTTLWYRLNQSFYNNDFDCAATDFRQRFKEAVKLHLRSDVPVGSALSGGLDSSAIVCEVSKILSGEGKKGVQKTFSSVDLDERYSEKKWMDKVIQETEVESHFVYPSVDDLLVKTSRILWHQDEPYQSQSVYLGYHVFELAKVNHVKVLLNGQGADEYLSGYSEFRLARWRKMFSHLQWKQLNKEFEFAGIKGLRVRFFFVLKFLAWLLPVRLNNFFSRRKQAYKELLSVFDISKLDNYEFHPMLRVPRAANDPFSISCQQLFYSPLQKYLHWEDRNSMAHSIEARVPFLDHRLVELCMSMPLDYLDGPGETKKIMLHGLRDLLPIQILNRKDKMGFTTPEERWVKTDFTDSLRNKIVETISSSQGIIRPAALDYFDKIVAGKLPFDYTYWRIILFGEWLKLFEVKIS